MAVRADHPDGPRDSHHGTAPAIGRTQLPWLALLSGLAVLLNALPLPLYYGIHVLLGSIPAILVLLLWRSWWGIAIGALASLQTWPLWGHPWAIVIFTLELVWLWIALRRCKCSAGEGCSGQVVLYAIGYWLLVGCPLVLLLYGLVMGIDADNVLLVAVKQSFNGVLNTALALASLIAVRVVQARDQPGGGPGISLRGVILALAMLAITVPTLVVSIAAGHQLQIASQQGVLDTLKTINLAVAQANPASDTHRQLIHQLGAIAYRRIGSDGAVTSSDPALFRRLDSSFRDGGRENARSTELAILIPAGQAPAVRLWMNGFWSYSRQYAGGDGITLVQVVEPSRAVVQRMQRQSGQLLGISTAVLVMGALASDALGKRVGREFKAIAAPLKRFGEGSQLAQLQPSAVIELRELTRLINHRIRQMNRVGLQLMRTNSALRRSRKELELRLTSDPVTGCGNRRALQARLAEEWHRCERSGEALCCLAIDVEGLEAINRQHGRQAGDALLRGMALAAQRRLRVTDHLFRNGEDSFLVIATGCSPEDGLALGHELRETMAAVWVESRDQPQHGAGARVASRIQAMVHMGISCVRRHSGDPVMAADTLVSQAMTALRQAHRQGAGPVQLHVRASR